MRSVLFNWQEFLTILGGQAVFLGAAAYLIKALVSTRLERETEAFKAELKRNADIEIERLKSSLQIAALEHQVRFSQLHEQRVDVISQLSKEIVEVPAVVREFVVTSQKDKESLKQAMERTAGLNHLIQTSHIILPGPVCILLDELSTKLWDIIIGIQLYWTTEDLAPAMQSEKVKVLRKAVSAFENEIPELQKKGSL